LFPGTEAIEVLTLSHHSREPMDAYAPLICMGFYVMDHARRTISRFLPRRACVLATGGAAGAFANTSNVDTAIGSGIALVHRRGGRVRAVHAVQFHPTGLALPRRIMGRRELVTEKVRGDGARFTDQFGSLIPELQGIELQPRDQVARALYTYMRREGRFVYLDLRKGLSGAQIREKFPKLYDVCLKLGLDITAAPIPVEPVAHYHNGGVWVDPQTLETSIGRLYALGELKNLAHGYNRLASTSTRECVYDAWLIAPVLADLSTLPDAADRLLAWHPDGDKEPAEQLLWNYEGRIKEILWNWVGIIRAEEELKTAVQELQSIQEIVQTLYFRTRVSPQVILVRNLIIVALLMARGALGERESCGCHYRVD
ncbi:MAG: FAD-binding protein, partial [Nevskia sp.]|nr:FAD-binding protein [Nevskia sp.]